MTDTDAIRSEAQQTFRDHLTFLSSGRIREWVALFEQDGVLEFPYGPQGFPSRVEGHDGLYEYMKNFPESFEVVFEGLVFHETVDPTLVVAEFRSKGTAKATGKPYDQTYISVVRTREGKITSYVDFWNPLVAMESLTADGGESGLVGAFSH
ncbi:nuclear transport factor 2 family protein [Phycicoccus sp. BSK3Z-2]|uniref:Nuclear transport factor 2 family protein n=1 Tax=Phycicoccus avicenniae TaxID=2828860 RepID=A0A941HYH9_9MICO|nr:nuclear transport factor 2 family protein [Phycicoccus avicenniae]MBR7741862.1 nuclear transport factor 2 family protein [Phycicoccus avicenniae]